MNTIIENIEILSKLEKSDKIGCINNKLIINDNDFQDIHDPDVKLVILNTLLLATNIKYRNVQKCKDFLRSLNKSIENIYLNEYISESCKEDQQFYDFLELCDNLYMRTKRKYLRSCHYFIFRLDSLFTSFLQYCLQVCKDIHEVNMYINMMPGYANDSDNEDTTEEDKVSQNDGSEDEVSEDEVSEDEESEYEVSEDNVSDDDISEDEVSEDEASENEVSQKKKN